MTIDGTRATRRFLITMAWATGVVGVITTAISLLPALATITAFGADAPGSALILIIQALGCTAVPVLVGLAIANVARRWWAWLIAAALLVVLLLVVRNVTGTLGVYWLPA
ncbi:hypothetical protein AB0O90_06290 [Microbacterium testaceum]|uniref:hypothetical protein n=1 Tax=Microbacterium testaceum TaxID=2033 RepID=UPI00341AB443